MKTLSSNEVLSVSSEETEQLAADLATTLKPGFKLALCGELGGGKTAFVRGLYKGLKGNHEELVSSPTFTLMQEYPTPSGMLYHLDLYRLSSYREFEMMDLEETLGISMAVVEWGDKFPELENWFDGILKFEFISENERKIRWLKKIKP